MDTTNKVALITGANKGIGFATARRLGELGRRYTSAHATPSKASKPRRSCATTASTPA